MNIRTNTTMNSKFSYASSGQHYMTKPLFNMDFMAFAKSQAAGAILPMFAFGMGSALGY
jgi:hypothetical protein